jgi:hypothetical protein
VTQPLHAEEVAIGRQSETRDVLRTPVRRGRDVRLLAAIALSLTIALASAPSAGAVPIVTYKCSPAPQDCSGWHRSDVSIDWTVLPSDATVLGCQDKTYTTDTAGTNELCSADDGVASVTVQLKIKVDKTPPETTTGTPSRAADANGWYSGPVGIAFSGVDATSGIDSCTAMTYSGPESGGASVAGTCSDKAGNVSAPFPYGLKYDETAPSVTGAVPERSASASGWFNRPIGFDVQGTDGTSGIASCPSKTYAGPDSAIASFTGTCTDNAGNSATRQFGLKYDSAAPATTGAQPARGPDANGWYRNPVSIAFSGSDQLSGIRSCATIAYAGPDSGEASAPGTCTDEAGNVSSPFNFKLSYDATGPVVTAGQAARSPDTNGWYNHAVGIAFSGSDQTSGVQSCTSTVYGGPNSATGSVPGTCTDRAGNTSGALGFGLKYDETGPSVTGVSPDRQPDANGWYNHAVGFDFAASDDTSGLSDCTPVTYAAPDSAAATVTGRCQDSAGNVSSRAFPLKYDATPPATTGATPGRGPNDDGWYNRPVPLSFDGADQTSGIQDCTSTSYDGPDSASASVLGSCRDNAGNRSAARDFRLKYDETAPRMTGAAPDRPPNDDGWYNRPVPVAFSGSDATSGVDGCSSPSYDGPDTATASVSGACTDKAGNSSAPLAFDLKYDETIPEVTDAQAERKPGADGWFLDPVRFDFVGTDETAGIAACPSVTYSGPDGPSSEVVGECRDRAGNVARRSFPLKFDGNPPDVTDLTVTPGDRRLDLSWHATADVVSVEVLRTPGLGTDAATVVFRGPGSSFRDERVANGVRYTYEVTVTDTAGNRTRRTVAGTPVAAAAPSVGGSPPAAVERRRAPRMLAPLPGAIIRMGSPPLLRWVRVKRAAYYNVQIFLAGRKVLTAWPTRPRYQLQRSWTFAGRRYRLRPGHYRWMVWPGFGRRSRANYGKVIGRSDFVVKR